MSTSRWDGGSVEQQGTPDNCATVLTAESTQAGKGGAWVLVLKEAPRRANFTKGMKIVYNAKGTRNPNADNMLIVTHCDGPAKYRCDGPYPIKV